MGSHQGIKELMSAEQKASQIVSAARQERGDRMKQARLEAEKEINLYRESCDRKFEASSGSDKKDEESRKLQEKCDQELEVMRQVFEKNADVAVKLLKEQCWKVQLKVSGARKRQNRKGA